MRVILIQQSLEMGGAERQALLLARHLATQPGVQVEYWGFGPEGAASASARDLGIPARSIDCSWKGSRWQRLAALLRLTAALRRARPDVLLPYTMPPNVLCSLVWRHTRARACLWNQRDEGRQRFSPRLERRAARRASAFLSNSSAGRDFLQRELGVPGVHVILNGVELPEPAEDRASWRARLGVSGDALVACMVANLHAYKDHETLLHAWSRVLAARAGDGAAAAPVLVLAGRPAGTQDRLGALTDELGIRHAVRYTGAVRDVAGLLHASDLVVFSSRFEGCPNAILEGMAAGLPVVATDISGSRDALGDQVEVLAPPGDADALAQRILALMNDPGLRRAHARRNLERARTVFAPDRMCRETTELLRRCLTNGRSAAW